ncbi:transglutaminase domain-containing protein, partial [Actinokineospora sp.]|uniref:transglutaminase domain-containing protein n=1 Tax=Actinokineospora sp. TaxID=1872133 RepID=UPI003D6BC144
VELDALGAAALVASSAVAEPPTAQTSALAAKAAPAPEIVALAESLGRSPARIFRFVHDSIAYQPQWGANVPPVGTLQLGRGTSWEQAWLLQELLLAAGVDARLEWGEVEITPAMLLDLAGVTDVFRAGDLLATGNIKVVLVVQGGQVVAARLPHVWVKAHLDYIPNRGVTPGEGDTWLRLDPTLERFDEANGARLDAAVPFVLGEYLRSGTESSPRATYEAVLLAHAAGQGGGGLEELKPLRAVKREEFPYVPGTLRAKLVSVAGEAAAMPAAMQQQVSLSLLDRNGASLLSATLSAPQVWGQRLELTWVGATAADQSTLDLYGGVFATPPYEVDLRASLRLEGVEVAAGTAVGSAEDVELRATLTPPGGVQTFATWPMFAGEHGVLGVAFGGVSQEVVDRFAAGQTAAGAAEREGWGLAHAAALYLRSAGADVEHLAALRWHRVLELGTAVLAVQRGAVSTSSDGTPLTFELGPLSVDVGAMPLALVPAAGPQVSTAPTMELIGAQGSVREGEALATAFGGEQVTAVGFLTRAVRAGQALTLVQASNLEAALAEAELSADAEAYVRFSVERGLVAWIPRTQLAIGGWQTTGYVIENPANGTGAYLVTFERKVVLGQSAVTFHAPTDLAVVTAPTEVVASITAENLESWTLSTRPVGESETTTIAAGTGPVDHKVLGTFDPTLLFNGMHDLVLSGTTAGGRTVTGRITVSVEGGMKIGNFTISFVDLAVPLSGLAIEIARTYDSRGRGVAGDFGYGWTLDVRGGSYRNNRKPGEGWKIKGMPIGGHLLPCQSVAETGKHLTTIRLSDREVYKFRPTLSRPAIVAGGCFAQAGFAFLRGPEPGARLEVLGDTEVFWQAGSNRVVYPETFEPYDPVKVRLTTRDGRAFDLDLEHGVTGLAEPNGNRLEITAAGITHSSGESIQLTRDAAGRISGITDLGGGTILYGYNAAGDLVSVIDRAGETTQFGYTTGHYLTAITDARGVTPLRNEYDADGRLVRHLDAFEEKIVYDHRLEQRQEVVTDRLGNSRLLAYDERGNVVREVDALGHETRRAFNEDDQLLQETDPLGNTTVYTYDTALNLTALRDPLGNVTRYTYDPAGNVLTTTDPLGKVTTNRYDAAANLISTTDPAGAATTYSYDERGNLLTERDALGNTTTNRYDDKGIQLWQDSAAGHRTELAHDRWRRRVWERTRRTLPDGQSEALVTTFGYDGLDRVVETVLPGGISTKTVYNAIGQVAETIDPLGRRTSFTYDEMGRQTSTRYPDGTSDGRAYDAEGRLAATTDRGGHVTTYVYDTVGRLTRTIFADGSFTTSNYDAAGRLVASTDARGNITSYTYDAAGRRTRVLDALSGATDFEYDAAGGQVAVIDARRQTTRFVYDDAGRLVRTVLPDGTSRAVEYDALGRRVAETDQASKVTRFGYDALGRLLTVTDALNQVTGYAYDEVGNRTGQTDANDHTTRFEYDA